MKNIYNDWNISQTKDLQHNKKDIFMCLISMITFLRNTFNVNIE